MDGGAWLATVHGVAKSQIQLSDFTITITKQTINSAYGIENINCIWQSLKDKGE